MNLDKQAQSGFNSGYNCAESILLVLSEQPELNRRGIESFVPRIATGFGGGIARNGNVCGALTGGIMAISLALGRDRSDESRDPCYYAVDRFYNDFVEEFGSCRCRELTAVDLKAPNGRSEYQKRVHFERCNPIVGWAVRRAYQIIKEGR